VSVTTLYSYVSRGLVHPVAWPGERGKSYSRSELDRVAQLHAGARRPAQVAVDALDFGKPVLESSVSLLQAGRIYYRGVDAMQLAENAPLEDVGSLLCGWKSGGWSGPSPPSSRRLRSALARHADRPMPQRMLSSFHAVVDDWGLGAGPVAPEVAARRCLQGMVVAATGRPLDQSEDPIHVHLQRAWALPAAAARHAP
jgi:citrate synthase